MGISACVVKGALDLADNLLAKYVLDDLGVVMDMVRGDLGLVGEVELPKAVVADDLAGTLPACRSEVNAVAFIMQGN